MSKIIKTCIVCPKGCRLVIESEPGFAVTGNKCRKGEEFAKEEINNPVRTLQTTVKTVFKGCERLPVKTSAPIPKGLMMDAVKEAKKITVDKRLKMGDIVIKDILGTGISFAASKSVDLNAYEQ